MPCCTIPSNYWHSQYHQLHSYRREPWSDGQRLRQHSKQPNGIHWCHFQPYISHKAAKSMTKLISQSCGYNYSQLHTFPESWSHLETTKALIDVCQTSETSRSKSSLDNLQHQYLSELLVNAYSYHLQVKHTSCYCVCGNRLSQIQSHIIL